MSGESKLQTLEHIDNVQKILAAFMVELLRRSTFHDNSKLKSPEVEIFDEFTPKLKDMTYGSEEYKKCLAEMRPALEHHYIENRHHPEHWVNGVDNMNLVDIVEMFSDWLAATKRHADGNIMRSIEINEKRFRINPQLCQIFRNTVYMLEEMDKMTITIGEQVE
jgi:hypothetical protein